mgnify:CR=1 FL=1|tara:strand:- start:456 stop:1928 length:1473 start_codon:yes stop_codon:yes gene_type:complete
MTKTQSDPSYSWPAEDRLGREKDAEILLRFISGKLDQREKAGLSRSYVLNLDSQWGSGKTFFLKNLKHKISSNGHVAVYVDAWKDDHSNDPFLAVVTGIEQEIENFITGNSRLSSIIDAIQPVSHSAIRILGSGVKSGALHFLKKKVGQEAVEAFAELVAGESDQDLSGVNSEAILDATNSSIDVAGEAILAGFKTSKTARASFRENLEDLIEKLNGLSATELPVFVLIDELDRCRPSYAVELLEEVKHLFDVENLVFILATDTEQLAHAVSGLYGPSFDGRRYLSRFIDRTYSFKETDIPTFVKHCFEINGLSNGEFTIPEEIGIYNFLSKAFERAGSSLRYIEQIMDYISTFAATWKTKDFRINAILLFDLAVRSHPESKKGEDGRYIALGTTYPVPRYAARGAINTTTSLGIEEMVRDIKHSSASVSSSREPQNAFERWAQRTAIEEYRAMKLLDDSISPDEFKGIACEYPNMFHELLSVHDTIEKQ